MTTPAPTPAASLRDRIAAAAEAAVTAWDADVPGTEGRHLHEVIADAVLPLLADAPEAYPPVHRWRVEHLDGEGWVHASGTKTNRAEAVAQLRAGETNRPLWADGTPVQRRLIRETTTYAVEDAEPAPADTTHPGGES